MQHLYESINMKMSDTMKIQLGLVEINPNPKNKSKNIVRITDKGRNATKEFKATIEDIENVIFKKYNNEEKEKLKIMLRDLAREYDDLR